MFITNYSEYVFQIYRIWLTGLFGLAKSFPYDGSKKHLFRIVETSATVMCMKIIYIYRRRFIAGRNNA